MKVLYICVVTASHNSNDRNYLPFVMKFEMRGKRIYKGFFIYFIMNNKGCVYFFKIIGLNPVKIGFTGNKTPMCEFDKINNNSPYGVEIVGFIPANDPELLKNELCEKYVSSKTKNDWFDISKEQVLKEIDRHTEMMDAERMNKYYRYYFTILENKATSLNKQLDEFFRDNIQFETRMEVKSLFNKAKSECINCSDIFVTNTPHLFSKQLKQYCLENGYEYHNKASNGVRYYIVTKQ